MELPQKRKEEIEEAVSFLDSLSRLKTRLSKLPDGNLRQRLMLDLESLIDDPSVLKSLCDLSETQAHQIKTLQDQLSYSEKKYLNVKHELSLSESGPDDKWETETVPSSNRFPVIFLVVSLVVVLWMLSSWWVPG